MQKKNSIILITILAVTALVIIFTLQTGLGLSLVKGFKDTFTPTKKITQTIEGQDEEIDVHLKEGTHGKYVMYIDEEHYKMTLGVEADVITPLAPLPEHYPPVTMEIRHVAGTPPDGLVGKIEADLKEDFPELRAVETVTDPIEGYWLHGTSGGEWNSNVVTTYIVSDGKEGSFVITEHFFLEAAEGHGARFHHMLKSFEIVE